MGCANFDPLTDGEFFGTLLSAHEISFDQAAQAE